VATNLSGSCSTTARSQISLQRSLVLPRKGGYLQSWHKYALSLRCPADQWKKVKMQTVGAIVTPNDFPT